MSESKKELVDCLTNDSYINSSRKYGDEIRLVIDKLSVWGVKVRLVPYAADNIRIAELKNGVMTVNTQARDDESLLFTLGHLFGHYVQFNNFDRYKHLIEQAEEKPMKNITSEFRNDFWEYEKEAFRIGKGLLMSVINISEELERKFEIFMHTDYEFFFKYLETGKNITPEKLKQVLNERYSDKSIVFDKYLEPIFIDENLKINPGMYVDVY